MKFLLRNKYSRSAAALLLLCASQANADTIQYKLTDLGLATNALASGAIQINSTGEVAGYEYYQYSNYKYFTWSPSAGFKYRPDTTVRAINDNGIAVGYDILHGVSVAWDTTTGTQISQGKQGSIFGTINNSGTVAGSLSNGYTYDAAVWIGSDPVKIGPLGNSYSGGNSVTAINNSNAVAGDIYNGDNTHAFFWSASQGVIDLGTVTSAKDESHATGINDLGAVVGWSNPVGVSRNRGFVWTAANGLQDIGTPYGDMPGSFLDSLRQVRALDINNSGTIVGYAQSSYSGSDADAFIWSAQNGSVRIDTLLSASSQGWHISSAKSINDAGVIAATAVFNGVAHTVVLTPVPEPATYLLMTFGCGFIWLGVRLGRKQ